MDGPLLGPLCLKSPNTEFFPGGLQLVLAVSGPCKEREGRNEEVRIQSLQAP